MSTRRDKRGIFREDVTHVIEAIIDCFDKQVEKQLRSYIAEFRLRDEYKINKLEDELTDAVLDGLKSDFFWKQLMIGNRRK